MNNLTHRVFSFRRMAAIVGNTLTGLTRLKIFYVLLLFALLLIGSSVFLAQMTFQQEFQVLKATPKSSETTLDTFEKPRSKAPFSEKVE